MFRRKQLDILLERIAEPRMTIQVICGPRQVGKTTIVKQAVQGIEIPYSFVSADDAQDKKSSWISDIWESARARLALSKAKEFLLIFDEIHKIDNWSETVKKEWDADSFNDINIKVVLLGSSRLLIKDGLTESLAGRFELIKMPHWSYNEMHDAFGIDINKYVYFGGYPGSAAYTSNEKRWCNYIRDSIIEPSIEKDIFSTKRVVKPALMRQLFELGCTYSGEELSLNKIVGQLTDAGNVTTLSNYLTTLDESSLLCGMQKYANDNARKYNSVPKLMVYNTALLSALANSKFEDTFVTPKQWGRWVESAVGAHLMNLSDTLGCKVYYWRERNDEVDFVVEYQKKLVAIEVKSGRRTTNAGLKIFSEKYQPKASFVVGSGGISLEEFLSADLENLF